MIFDVIVGNPPYQGHWDPLYLQITKSVYDNNMGNDSVMCMINPTSVIENKFEGDPHYEKSFKKYSNICLIDFKYDESIRGLFPTAEVGSDFGIFVYGRKGNHNLFDDWVCEVMYGKDYIIKKNIIDKIQKHPRLDLETGGFFYLVPYSDKEKIRKKIDEVPSGFYCLCSLHRGHNGKWDWTTFNTARNLICQTSVIDNQWNIFRFGNKENCISFIKWLNTDIVQFVIEFFKHSLKNSKILLEKIPSLPSGFDFSDENIIDEFGFSRNEVEYIHESMKGYGWKTRTNKLFGSEFVGTNYKCPSVKLDGSEKTFLQFVDELNRIN